MLTSNTRGVGVCVGFGASVVAGSSAVFGAGAVVALGVGKFANCTLMFAESFNIEFASGLCLTIKSPSPVSVK